MEGQRTKHIAYGRKRMNELLEGLGFADIQAKRTGLHDWSVQFARPFVCDPLRDGWRDPVCHGLPVWDTEWIPVSELEKEANYLEIWPVFRERICSQTTLAHAAIGDIINSKGENTSEDKHVRCFDAYLLYVVGGKAAGPLPSARPGSKSKPGQRPNGRRALPDALVSIKQEETIDPIEVGQAPIDLTSETLSSDDLSEGAPEPLQDADCSDHIDLTGDDVIDLTITTFIDLSNEDGSKDKGTPWETVLRGGEARVPALQSDSDNDSLFGGPEPEIGADAITHMEWQPAIEPEKISPQSRNSRPVRVDRSPTSGHLTTKKGRMRALDFDDEQPPNYGSRHKVEPPRKKQAIGGMNFVPSVLTAEKGKMVERNREGVYKIFDAKMSAGSALAVKVTNSLVPKDTETGAREGQVLGSTVVLDKNPPTDPDELEDYEEEEEPPVCLSKGSTPDPELQAYRDKWKQVSKRQIAVEPAKQSYNRAVPLAAPSPFSPPLFLLRISKTQTLRLMARNCSIPHAQFFVVAKEEETRPESEPIYMQHKQHLLDLLPQYHLLAWQQSLKRRGELKERMDGALVRKDMEQLQQLEKEYQKELDGSWRLGEKEKTKVIPRSANMADAEKVLFMQHCSTSTQSLSYHITEPSMRTPGSWAELVLHQHGYVGPSEQDQKDYTSLAEMLEKEEKFLVVENEVVNKHYGCPHTLVIFASRSRKIGELCGLPEDMMRSRRSLVVVHLGWRLAAMEHGVLPVFLMQ